MENKKIKTLANCNAREFFTQTAKISKILSKYIKKIKAIRNESGEFNFFTVLDYICGENINDTMEVCGALCFMSASEFEQLDTENGEDGIMAITSVITSPRCVNFFMSCMEMMNFIDNRS